MRALKLAVVVSLFMLFISGAVILRFYAVTEVNRRRIGAWWTTKLARMGLRVMGISWQADGRENIEPAGKLIISNHMSYLDVLIYAAIRPTVFISSVEIRDTPFLGFLAKLGGTFFVERRNPKLIKLEIGKMADLVTEGFNVVLFPEGTSTDGSKILPFRSSLLASASAANVDVVPACLKYISVDGELFSSENCDSVCWYGDMSFTPHMWNLMAVKSIKAQVRYFSPMQTSVIDRKELTRTAHRLISESYFAA